MRWSVSSAQKQMKNKAKIALIVILDIIAINLSMVIALLLRFDLKTGNELFQNYLLNGYLTNIPFFTAIHLVAILGNRLYTSLWKYVSIKEVANCGIAAISGCAGCLAYIMLFNVTFPRSVMLIAMVLEFLMLAIIRFAYRIVREFHVPGMFNITKKENEIRVLLVGGGDAGSAMIREMQTHIEQNRRIVAIIDDDPVKIGRSILGIKIVGDRNAILDATEKYSIDEIIVAIPTASRQAIAQIVEICQKTKCKVQILPSLLDLIDEKVSIKALRDVAIEDLLGREPVELSMDGISNYIQNQTVLVTGGGGSIGSEIVRQIGRFGPRKIVVFDIYENTCFELQQEMKRDFPNLSFEVRIGSVVNKTSVCELFSKYKPDVIFHAAAHKHVPLMEDSPREALINNVIGTNNVMDAALDHHAKKFILISTDKAVNPTSVMGASKRICEMLMQEHADKKSATEFVAVRFGNVLDSHGSVIPTFRKQIAQGGPVTVTHKDITRYFMTIPEAVQLVLEAGSIAKGGEVFILDMGEPVKILDLAEKLIRLSGSEPYVDVDIKFTGLRPGEKLYEELLLSEEGIKQTEHKKIFIGRPVAASEGLKEILNAGLDDAMKDLKNKTDHEIRAWIKKIVPNYQGAK